MDAVGVRELKSRLSYYLRRARRGEELMVTKRGHPVAVLHSFPRVDRSAALEARLARLSALGVVTLPIRKGFRRIRLLCISGRSMSKAILEARR
jgi:prevent-host-death family protein